jgi:hypothetical protein
MSIASLIDFLLACAVCFCLGAQLFGCTLFGRDMSWAARSQLWLCAVNAGFFGKLHHIEDGLNQRFPAPPAQVGLAVSLGYNKLPAAAAALDNHTASFLKGSVRTNPKLRELPDSEKKVNVAGCGQT